MVKKRNILVLGGGLSGLTAARSLGKKHNVTILEKSPFLGGLAGSFKQGKDWIPFYYHHVVSHNTVTQKYMNRYKMLDDAFWQRVNIVIGANKKIHNITKVPGLLGFNYMTFPGRIRFGLFGLYALFMMNPSKIPDDLDAETWLKKVAGNEVATKIFYNLYARNKFDVPLSTISAKQLANRLKEREVYDDFTFPKSGLNPLIDGLEKDCLKAGVKIQKSVEITNIDMKKSEVTLKGGKKYQADVIINSIPLPHFLKIAKGVPLRYKAQVSKIRYTPCVCIPFGTKEFLDKGHYWTNMFDERAQVIIQHSILCDKYEDKVNWVIRYGGSAEDIGKSDKELKELYLADVKKYYPDAEFTWSKVFREHYAEPVYDKDYENYKPDYRTPVANFFMTGIQVTHPKIRNMNTALESGEIVADMVLRDIKEGKF